MNWEQIKGKAEQLKGQAKQQWAELTDDDLQKLEGKREEFVGRLTEVYGISKEEADKQVQEFETSCRCAA